MDAFPVHFRDQLSLMGNTGYTFSIVRTRRLFVSAAYHTAEAGNHLSDDIEKSPIFWEVLPCAKLNRCHGGEPCIL
jgi:hypothetical protein